MRQVLGRPILLEPVAPAGSMKVVIEADPDLSEVDPREPRRRWHATWCCL